MLHLRGAPAFSPSRSAKLLETLQGKARSVTKVRAEFAHFAQLSSPLDAEEGDTLARLLTYGPVHETEATEDHGTLRLVVPRIGTISPWSSKATDIAHICGLAKVARLERGIAYWIEGSVAPEEWNALLPLLHDRMTQTVLERSGSSSCNSMVEMSSP